MHLAPCRECGATDMLSMERSDPTALDEHEAGWVRVVCLRCHRAGGKVSSLWLVALIAKWNEAQDEQWDASRLIGAGQYSPLRGRG